jgi:hypothetical protein
LAQGGAVCGKSNRHVKKLIAGPGVYIWVEMGSETIEEDAGPTEE